ncbi:hypothetical protein [Aurantiacibacter zhengii]|uniref:Copper resistance protein NlpE n=1 Tax=Aurantiacibacter zhengii TaxID=2307003 RepID=A0A418NP37_9SPHN|nr:hypothetical protein [Aurantiacibacter zhengii]RIV83884.1 hypothetical protein D2V07_15485 [Aurantiacibacter zhengii]
MRNFTLLMAAAPLALLAACGGNDADEAEMDTDADMTAEADMTANDTAMSADSEPGPATSQAEAGDYSGVYSYTDEQGAQNAVRLNSSDNTYDYVGADGEMRSGSYTWDADGYRLNIEDFNGEPASFAISNGDLVRLQNDTALDSTMTVTGDRYRRAEESDAVFSRFPEPGSPVAPAGG